MESVKNNQINIKHRTFLKSGTWQKVFFLKSELMGIEFNVLKLGAFIIPLNIIETL